MIHSHTLRSPAGGVRPGYLASRAGPRASLRAVFLLASLIAITNGRLQAADWNLFGPNAPDLEFHGFASQGFLGSTKYNYLGDTTHGSLMFTELGLNVAFDPFPRTVIEAQAFVDDVGQAGRYDALLDYALAQYTFNDYFGIRAGRIRRPQGIYNDIQDVDLGRTFVLLPQGIYDARYRDFYVSLDGLDFFGTLPLDRAGSLAYEIYGGLARPSLDGGAALQLRNFVPPSTQLDVIDPVRMFGTQLWWNTPIDGFRLGASGLIVPWLNYLTTTQTPAGPIRLSDRSDVFLQQYSAEYQWKAWTFQTEALFRDDYPTGAGAVNVHNFSWYASGEYRFNKWLEAGSYYTEYYNDIGNRSGAGQPIPSDAYQKDAAVALRFDLTDRWIFKVEGHYLRGTALLEDNAENPNRRDSGWWMLAVKTTISF